MVCLVAGAKGQQQETTSTSVATTEFDERRIPASIADVDNGQIMGFGADLAEDHPGFGDQAYKDRRTSIANMARAHRV